jgi:signal transducing adaptor molecule
MIKRLAHRNANVQLYTLELANALSQNCGVAMHRELASRSFTDAMLRLAGDRVSASLHFLYGRANEQQTTHQQVKSKILERMDEWTKMFSSNTELGIMEQAYMRLKSQSEHVLCNPKQS